MLFVIGIGIGEGLEQVRIAKRTATVLRWTGSSAGDACGKTLEWHIHVRFLDEEARPAICVPRGDTNRTGAFFLLAAIECAVDLPSRDRRQHLTKRSLGPQEQGCWRTSGEAPRNRSDDVGEHKRPDGNDDDGEHRDARSWHANWYLAGQECSRRHGVD